MSTLRARARRRRARGRPAPPGTPAFDTLKVVLQAVGLLLGPSAIVAMLYYFGWSRINAQFAYLGVDQSLLKLNREDYLLRSITSAFQPLALALLLSLGLSIGVVAAGRIPPRSSWQRGASVASGCIGVGGLCLVVIGIAMATWVGRPAPHPGVAHLYVVPILLAVGLFLIFFAVVLFSTAKRISLLGDFGRLVSVTLILLLTLQATFWAVSEIAGYRGRAAVIAATDRLDVQPDITLYSRVALNMDGRGVRLTRIPLLDSYQYRYRGLRVLMYTNGKYVILPCGWRYGDAVFIVDDSPDLRVELRRAPFDQVCLAARASGSQAPP